MLDRFEALFEGFMDRLSLYKGLEDGESIGGGPGTIGPARTEQFPIYGLPHREYMRIHTWATKVHLHCANCIWFAYISYAARGNVGD